jgi:hypothetical protein
MSKPIIGALVGAVLAAAACSTTAQVAIPWPQGTAFPLMMYAVSAEEASNLTPYGWNILQSYGLNTTNYVNDYLQGLLTNGVAGMAEIPAAGTNHPYTGWPWSEVLPWVLALEGNANLAWWSLPEEMHSWMPSELQLLGDYTAWTHMFDMQHRPTYEYVPNGRGASEVSRLAPNVDVIGLGCYCEYIGMPHAWVRYVMQETGLKGIAMAGRLVGNDYVAGQSTPVAVLYVAQNTEVNTTPPTMPTPSQTYHDFWSAIASGARGISVFSYWHAVHDDPSLAANLQQLNLAASQITGPEKIGDVVLYGAQNTNVAFTILSGPMQTVAFQPPGDINSIQYPSLNVLSKTWSGSVYVIAVNSTDESVTAILSNVPSATASAVLPFESRTVTVTNGCFTDSFPAWGVHIYKLPAHAFLSQFTVIGGGLYQFSVNNSGVPSYTVESTTNLLDWAESGPATQVSPGTYQFTDPGWSNGGPGGMYRLRWP